MSLVYILDDQYCRNNNKEMNNPLRVRLQFAIVANHCYQSKYEVCESVFSSKRLSTFIFYVILISHFLLWNAAVVIIYLFNLFIITAISLKCIDDDVIKLIIN